MSRFSLREDSFPYQSSVGGLYLNSTNPEKQSMLIARTISERYLPDVNCLIELKFTPAQAIECRKLDVKYFTRLKDKESKSREVRDIYFDKLVDYGCINVEQFTKDCKSRGISKDTALNLAVMNMPFSFDGKIRTYQNLTRSEFFYHMDLDIIIEVALIELFVYNAKMVFLKSDIKGLEFCRYLKNLENVTTKPEQEALINDSIIERLHKRMTKKIGSEVSLTEFKNNFESYKTIYDMWRV